MKEPKGSVLLLALTVFIVTESAPVFQEEKLPHSQDYYDGYVKALVDHFDDLFRNTREVSADNSDSKVADVASNEAAKKDDIQSASSNSESNISGRSQQVNDQNNTVQDRPYTNPEETGKAPASDTEKEEQPTPDAHLNKENKQVSTSPEETKQNMFKTEDATSIPETMQDVKLYTGKSMDFEDMKKRSTDLEASTNEKSVTAKTFVFKPKESLSTSTVPAAIPLAAQAAQTTQTVTASANAPLVASASMPVATAANMPVVTAANALLTAPVSVPAAQSVAQLPAASSATPGATSSVSQPVQENTKRNDMQSESKVISHSSSTYTPGDPSKTPPQQVPTPPDPNKEEPYKKDEKNEIEEEEKQKDDENSKSMEEDDKEDERQKDDENSKSTEEDTKEEEKQKSAENSKAIEEDDKEEERERDAENTKSMEEDPKEEETEKDADNEKSIEEDPNEEEQTNMKPKKEKFEDANKNMKEADKTENDDSADNVENYDEGKKEVDKEISKESDEEGNEEEFSSTSVQPFMGMVLLPMEEMQNAGSLVGSAGERKDSVGAKRGDGDKKKDDKKDDDDDEHHDHAYLAPLCGYPGWYEAGHGIPYGYGTNMLYGCHGHHGHRGHHCLGLGDLGYGLGGCGFGHHGFGHHGYGFGHHGYGFGHHGYGLGHHGYGLGHHGYGYGGLGYGFGHHGLRLDNGVIWPYGGEVVAFFNTPCGCSSEPFGSNVGHSLPVSI